MPAQTASQTAIDQFTDALWPEDGLSRNTLAAYRSDLRHFADWLAAQAPPVALDEAAEHHIQAWFAARHHGTRATTANRRLSVLRRYFHWALRERRIAADPSVRLQAARHEAERLPHKTGEAIKESKTGKDSCTAHAANRAKRYTEKRLLRMMFAEWRRCMG